MDKKIKFTVLGIVIIVLIIGAYFVYNHLTLPNVSIQTMKYCTSDSDCIPVDCSCNCSGCGGFSYDDVVNKKYVDAWYYQQGCKPVQVCPMVCCMPRTIACENDVCVVKEPVANKTEPTVQTECERGICPDGRTYEKYTLIEGICVEVNYVQDPCSL